MRSNTAQVACLSSALLVLVVGFHSSPEARSDVLPHGPQIIGETSALRLETPHPYPEGSSSAPVVWRAGVRHPGATYITLHLERLELAPGDHLAILDRTGKEQARMTGRGPLDRGADLWTPAVDGEIAILELRAGGMRTTDDRFGLIVDRYAHGFEPIVPADGGTDAVCGSDQRRDAICYSSSHPTEYDKARAVGRLLINGTGTCTGWLVSCEGHMMTANHCLASQSAVENTEIRMMYERSGCGTGDESWDRVLHGKDLVRSSSTAGLDYTLFTVVEDASEYGFFGLDPRLPREGERIYLPAHHGGQVKRFGIESDNEPEGVCRVTESPFLLNSEDILYYCDTTGSSSGAPVVSGITHRVLALNRTQTEGCAYGNQGARVDLIFPEIRDALPACSFSPDFVLDSSELLDDTTGNGSGLADPGETLRWKITLENRGTSPSTATVGTLTSEHLFVNILDGEADFTDIPDGASGSTLAPHFEVRIGRGVACGSRIPFTLAVEADEGSAIVPLLLEIGDNLGGPLFYSATDVPVAIPNGSSAGVTSSIDVPELFAVADVFAQPDISHTYVGDLTLELTSPASTTARLHAKTGWSRDELRDTYDRDVLPDGPGTMGDFDGEDSQGSWTLRVIDDAPSFDAGTLHAWTLELHEPDEFVCDSVGPSMSPGEASPDAPDREPLRVSDYDPASGEVTVSFDPACGSSDHAAYSGDLASVASLAWNQSHCALGSSGSASFDPGPVDRFFVVVGQDGEAEGSYGRGSDDRERAEASGLGSCDLPQDLSNPCP